MELPPSLGHCSARIASTKIMPHQDDHDLEDHSEFIRMFTKSQFDLYAYILGMTHNMADADDVLQEVNLALWKKRSAYDPQYSFLPWAIGFARIEINNHRKKNHKSKLLFSDDVLNLLAIDWPVDSTYQEQRLTALNSCLKKLASRERRYVTEFYRHGTSVNELSDLYDRPASTIYKILNRARKSLRLCIQATITQSRHPA